MANDDHPKSPLPYEAPEGRPAKINDPEIRNRILAYLRMGQPQNRAAMATHISVTTFHEWMRRGRAEKHRREEGLEPRETETVYADFAKAVTEAKAEGEAQLLAAVRASITSGGEQVKETVDPATGQVIERIVTKLPGNIKGAEFILRTAFGYKTTEVVEHLLNEDELAAKFADVAERFVSGLPLDSEQKAAEKARLADMLAAETEE